MTKINKIRIMRKRRKIFLENTEKYLKKVKTKKMGKKKN